MLIIKRKKITCENGYIYTNCVLNNSVEFAADIPADAIVDYVKVNGKTLDSLALNAVIRYPQGVEFEGQRVVALVRYLEEASNEPLYTAAQMAELSEFEVFYHDVAVATVEG